MNNYRQIYESHFGSIPKDEDGRTYEIHHIDGDHVNNDISNLKCVTIQEHYDIHYAQGDYGACYLIAIRMKLYPEELSEIITKSNIKRVENGTHHWLGGEIQRETQNRMVEEGTHNFLSGEISRKTNKRRIENGTHPFMIRNDGTSVSSDKVKAGTHHWLSGEIQKETANNRVAAGTHHFQKRPDGTSLASDRVKNGTHHLLNQPRIECPHCHKNTTPGPYKKWHGNNCKLNPINISNS